jgi:hypothetical protein
VRIAAIGRGTGRVGSLDDVGDVVKTAPWGTEQQVAVRRCRLDGELGWSLFIMADPTAGDDVEALVWAVSPDKKRAAVIGLAPRGRVYELDERVYELDERLRNTTPGGLDLREVAQLLQRFPEGMSWGKHNPERTSSERTS